MQLSGGRRIGKRLPVLHGNRCHADLQPYYYKPLTAAVLLNWQEPHSASMHGLPATDYMDGC
jgi:hypothetical protein